MTRGPALEGFARPSSLGIVSLALDRRAHDRLRFWLPMEVSGLDRTYAVSHDASDGGLLIVCNRALTVGDKVEVKFRLPPTGPITVTETAVVIRSSRNDEDPDGVWPYQAAIRFERPVPMLRDYLDKLESPVKTS